MTPDVDGANNHLAQLAARAKERRAKRTELTERVAALSVTEVGARGAIRLTIGPHGELTDLTLADSIRSLAPAQIAAQILATARRAQAQLTSQTAEVAGQVAGPPSPPANRPKTTQPEYDDLDDGPIMRRVDGRPKGQF